MKMLAAFGAAFGLAALLSSPALAAGGAGADETAAPSSQLQMAMTLYAAGITLGKVDMDATIRDGQYHVASNLTTNGLEPTLYDSFDTNHASKKQEVSLSYETGNPPRLYAEPAYKTTGYEVPA